MRHLVLTAVLVGLVTTGCGGQKTHSNSSTHAAKETVQETFVHKYGVEMSKRDWTDRGEEGKIIATRSDGVVVSETYVSGIKHGESTYSFPHSSIVAKSENYEQGNLTKEMWNYTSGVPMREDKITNELGAKTTTTWYEDGTPKSVENFENGLLLSGQYFTQDNEIESEVLAGNGTRINRDGFGELVSTDIIANGQIETATQFYNDGTPKAVIPYVANRIHGTKKTYGRNGEPKTIENWENDRQHGTTTLFRNGVKVSEVTYVNGRRHGIEKRFRDGDALVEEIAWSQDELHGPSRTYIGEQTKVSWYHEGRPVSKTAWEELNGSVIR